MKITSISDNKNPTFTSVIKMKNDRDTRNFYSLLRSDKSLPIDIISLESQSQSPTLILIDDAKGKDASTHLNLQKNYAKKRSDLLNKTETELEQLADKKLVQQAKAEISNPLKLSFLRGNTLSEKLGGVLLAELSNEFEETKEVLYKKFLLKAKTISLRDVFGFLTKQVR